MDKKKKYIIIGAIALVLIVGIVIACTLINSNSPNIPEQPDGVIVNDTRPPYHYEYQAPPEEMMPLVIDSVKTDMGEDFYPDKELTQEEILAEFGLTADDCVFVFGYACSDGKNDKLLGFAFADGKGEKVQAAVQNYLDTKAADTSLSEKEREAWKGAISIYNPLGYVYLSALFGDIEELETSKIAETMEIKNAEALDIIMGLTHTQLIEVPDNIEDIAE